MNTKHFVHIAIAAAATLSVPAHAGLLGGGANGAIGGALSGNISGLGGADAMGRGAGSFGTNVDGVGSMARSTTHTAHGVTRHAGNAVGNTRSALESNTAEVKDTVSDQASSAASAATNAAGNAVAAQSTESTANVATSAASDASLSGQQIAGNLQGSGVAAAASHDTDLTGQGNALMSGRTNDTKTLAPVNTDEKPADTTPIAKPAAGSPARRPSANADLSKQVDMSSGNTKAQGEASGSATTKRSSLQANGSGSASVQR